MEQATLSFLDTVLYGGTLRAWIAALLVALLVGLVIRVAVRWASNRFSVLARRTDTMLDDILAEAIGRTKLFFAAAVGVYAGAQVISLPAGVRTGLTRLLAVALMLQCGIWATGAVGTWLQHHRARRMADDPAAATTMGVLGFLARLAVWALVLILALDNLGVDITALVAGLGVGGIAVALAVQRVLGDLFASLSILLDKPFVIGDFLTVGEIQGSVERIGLKSTRLRSLSGEQVVVSNSDLLASRIRNFGRMQERRAAFTIGVTYETPRARLELIPTVLREAVEAQHSVRFERAHFKAYGDFAILFETVYFVTVPDYLTYMDAQQAINLRIHERFEQEGIAFAYPTQRVLLAKQDS